MYQTGDKVVYGAHGVCLVVEEESRVMDRKKVTYLVLEPVGQTGSRYLVPTHNAAAMAKIRPMLSAEDLEQLLSSEEVHSGGWIADENQRKQTYRELIGSGDRVRLMQMICALYRHKKAQLEAGKKIHLCDDNFLRDAERLLISEFAIVLDLEPEAARTYIRRKLTTE